MKRIALALAIVFCLSSVAFGALRAGSVGIEFENLLIGNPLSGLSGPYNTAGLTAMPALFYQFTEDVSGSVGFIYVSDPIPATDDTDTYMGLKLKGLWNLGSGKTVPHVGAEIGYESYTDASTPANDFTLMQLAILYGVEAMWLPGLSVMLDARLLDYQGKDVSGTSDTQLVLLSGATFGIRWYM